MLYHPNGTDYLRTQDYLQAQNAMWAAQAAMNQQSAASTAAAIAANNVAHAIREQTDAQIFMQDGDDNKRYPSDDMSYIKEVTRTHVRER